MKRKYLLFIMILTFTFFCFGCDAKYADTNRAIRHSGFAISGNEFVCPPLMPDENGIISDKIKFFTGDTAITESGVVYALSLGQLYSNDQNCMKSTYSSGTPKIKAIFDNAIAKADDGKIYMLGSHMQEVPADERKRELYNLIFADETIIKAMTYDENLGQYYALKTDGNIYNLSIPKQNYNQPLVIVSDSLVFSKNDYAGKIIDFNYIGAASGSYIRTENAIYRMIATNAQECSTYADKTCEFKMTLDTGLTEQRNMLLAFNGNYIITTYGKEFSG